ncbi:glycosyltransferase family 4 protein [Haloarcula marina]|uniref:glycosyltransferase family 4 protein n=1 Tax=Haloarcula marina TaxID=2961574 RepID=UPI0020B7343D|nr:glycosyltransferase family 4 protein [Halomicroarcula marina]
MPSVLVLSHRSTLNPRIELFAEALTTAGHDVEAICWDRSGSANDTRYVVPSETVSVPGLSLSRLNVLILPLLYLRFLTAILDREVDVLFCVHISLLPVAVVASKLTGTPLVYEVVEPFREGYGERSGPFANAFTTLLERIEKVCLHGVDGLTLIDTDEDVLVERYAGYTDNTAVVYNVPKVKPLPERARQQSQTIVYAGLVNERKGVGTLLEAFVQVNETHPDAKLLIIGDSADDTLAKLRRQAREWGVEDSVEFVGRVDHDAVHGHLCRADVGVAPYHPVPMFVVSRWNAQKIPDYMNAGLPVVGPAFGGFEQMLTETGCGLTVDTTEPRAIADALRTLLDDPERAKSLGENGRKAVERTYNWNTEQTKVVRVVERALSE